MAATAATAPSNEAVIFRQAKKEANKKAFKF